MKGNPLNRTNGPHILHLFDVCFKQGVVDASQATSFDAQDFVRRHSEDWSFGVLSEDAEIDWQFFRFVLYRWCRKTNLTKFAETYILRISAKNYLWCLLPYCMRFYMLGVSEWLKYPSPVRLEVFKSEPRTHWDRENNMAKFTKMDYISYMHEFAHAYQQLPEEERPVSSVAMDSFCSAVFDLTRKYARKSF